MPKINCNSSLASEEIKIRRCNEFFSLFYAYDTDVSKLDCFISVRNLKGFQNARATVQERETHQEMIRKKGKMFSYVSLDSDLLITAAQSFQFQTYFHAQLQVIFSYQIFLKIRENTEFMEDYNLLNNRIFVSLMAKELVRVVCDNLR